MPDLRAAEVGSGVGETGMGAGAVGTGVDVVAEVERLRSNVVELARLFEDLRAQHNAHTHGSAVAAPPAAEQTQTAFTLH